jgi:hypothetical protein
MILYVNGDSHAAAAECVNPHAWAEDDGMYWGLGQQPHPDNLRASFGCELANRLNVVLHCEAQAGCSNDRIIRTTRDWIEQNQDILHDAFLVIQWTTWEREEWLHEGHYYQVGASGTDSVAPALQEKYRHFIIGLDWNEKIQLAHDRIWQFHLELLDQNIRHVMFNGNTDFGQLQNRLDWGNSYIRPYDSAHTYNSVLRNNGFQTVTPASWHFGPDAHCFWAEYLLQYINDNNLIESNEIRFN